MAENRKVRFYFGGENRLDYFLQVDGCAKENRSKIKVSKWLDTPELKKNQQYLIDWHAFRKKIKSILGEMSDENQKAPVKMILLNNNFLGNVRQWQAMFFNRRYSFTPMMNPDYMKIASAYEIPARRVFTREELTKAIGEMIATDGPFLLEACVEEEGNVMPMTPPGGSVNQMLLECLRIMNYN